LYSGCNSYIVILVVEVAMVVAVHRIFGDWFLIKAGFKVKIIKRIYTSE